MLREEKVVTPTIHALLERKARKHDALFLMVPLSLLAELAHLGPNATLLFAVLYSVHRMQAEKAEYFALQHEFEEAIGRGYRWWHRHTQTLEAAGVIQVKRSEGLRPRYRILSVKTTKRRRASASNAT